MSSRPASLMLSQPASLMSSWPASLRSLHRLCRPAPWPVSLTSPRPALPTHPGLCRQHAPVCVANTPRSVPPTRPGWRRQFRPSPCHPGLHRPRVASACVAPACMPRLGCIVTPWPHRRTSRPASHLASCVAPHLLVLPQPYHSSQTAPAS